jgi:hypothetical protein
MCHTKQDIGYNRYFIPILQREHHLSLHLKTLVTFTLPYIFEDPLKMDFARVEGYLRSACSVLDFDVGELWQAEKIPGYINPSHHHSAL